MAFLAGNADNKRDTWMTRFSGALLVAIGIFGIWADLLPNL
jgi:hypothetical protein